MKAIASALILFVSVGFSADSTPLRLDLAASPLSVTFTNTGTEPLRVLKPLDGSEWCWIMPHYRLTVTDEHGQEVPFSIRCKLFGHPYTNTKWPEDYLVTIPAGGSYKHPLTPHHQTKATGTFSLRFQYIFTPKTNEFPRGTYPADLWRGESSSNTINTRLEPSP